MSLTYSQITAITEKYYLKRLVDNVYLQAAMLARLTQKGKMKLVEGGTSIMVPISSSDLGDSQWFSGADTITSPVGDNISAAEFAWKNVQQPVRIANDDLLKNSGAPAQLRLIESRVMLAEKSLGESLSKGIFSDGTAGTGNLSAKQITGLKAALDTTTAAYGGISSTDLATWTPYSVALNGALSLNAYQRAFGGASNGSMDMPTVAVMNQNVYDELYALCMPHQRVMNEEMGKLGFKALDVNGIPNIVDSHMVSQAIYFINENHTFLTVHKDRNMSKVTFSNLETSDTLLVRIHWMGNLCCDERRRNAVLSGITVAS